jgi:hypothetical protein
LTTYLASVTPTIADISTIAAADATRTAEEEDCLSADIFDLMLAAGYEARNGC